MKRYDVLDTHIGDKPYKSGDTRIAEEGDVAHLVALGILREAEDQSAIDEIAEPGPTPSVETGLMRQIEILTDERDAARAELAAMREERALAKAAEAAPAKSIKPARSAD